MNTKEEFALEEVKQGATSLMKLMIPVAFYLLTVRLNKHTHMIISPQFLHIVTAFTIN